MSLRSKPAGERLTARELCILALMGALIFASKFFGWKTLYAVGVYVMLEGMIFGFTLWWFSYLYTWPAVTAFVMLFRKNDSPLVWAVVAGLCGLCFGPLMYILYLTVTGWETAVALWVAGIPYDLVHCVSNFILTLLLYRPLYRVFSHFLPRRGQSYRESALSSQARS